MVGNGFINLLLSIVHSAKKITVTFKINNHDHMASAFSYQASEFDLYRCIWLSKQRFLGEFKLQMNCDQSCLEKVHQTFVGKKPVTKP